MKHKKRPSPKPAKSTKSKVYLKPTRASKPRRRLAPLRRAVRRTVVTQPPVGLPPVQTVSEPEQFRRILIPVLRNVVTGEFRTELVRCMRSATYLLHLSCVAVNAGLTKSLKDGDKVSLPGPLVHYLTAHYEGLLASFVDLIGRTDDVFAENVESLYDPRCHGGAYSSRPTAFGILNTLHSHPELFPTGFRLSQIAEGNHLAFGSTGEAVFAPVGVQIVQTRLLALDEQLAAARRSLREGNAVACVSPGGVHSADGMPIIGTALVLGLLGELIDLLYALSTMLGVKQNLVVPTIDMEVDRFCRTLLGVEFDAHGDLYGSTMMMKLLRENSGLRSLGLFLSYECRRQARLDMREDHDRPFPAVGGCPCPKCSGEKRRQVRNLLPDLPSIKMSYRSPARLDGQHDALVSARLGPKAC